MLKHNIQCHAVKNIHWKSKNALRCLSTKTHSIWDEWKGCSKGNWGSQNGQRFRRDRCQCGRFTWICQKKEWKSQSYICIWATAFVATGKRAYIDCRCKSSWLEFYNVKKMRPILPTCLEACQQSSAYEWIQRFVFYFKNVDHIRRIKNGCGKRKKWAEEARTKRWAPCKSWKTHQRCTLSKIHNQLMQKMVLMVTENFTNENSVFQKIYFIEHISAREPKSFQKRNHKYRIFHRKYNGHQTPSVDWTKRISFNPYCRMLVVSI